jgi:protein-S-isoprenylcysteine O-methyltransferase Ste14
MRVRILRILDGFLETLVPPPVLAALAAALMWAIAGAWPELRLDIPAARWIALALAAPGLLLDFVGVLAFLRARTTVNPMRPHKARELVTGGPYAWTRNPMYLGWVPILAGWAIYLEHPLTLLVVPLFVAYLTRFQIVPEERMLRQRFGAKFEAYARNVRRWI